MNGSASLSRSATNLRVAGLTRLSTCDWPGELVATIFCQGCGWDCLYCHNPSLRPAESESCLPWDEVVAFLESRKGLLDGVVFSGGEATLQASLLDAVQEVWKLGFRIGLHTAGMAPERFEKLLPWLDWVGFDVKAPFADYAKITQVEKSGETARASLRLLLASGVPFEARTTLHPALLSLDTMLKLKEELLGLGVTDYAVQRFRSEGTCAESLPPASEHLQYELPPNFGDGFIHFQVR